MHNNTQPQKPLTDRTIDYGIAIINFCSNFSQDHIGKHILNQLVRSATSVAANYAEASDAESKDDFVHKIKIVLKELKESRVWLLFASKLPNAPTIEDLHKETTELILIFGKSIKTANKKIVKSPLNRQHISYNDTTINS